MVRTRQNRITILDSAQVRIVRAVTPGELKELEAAGKIGWVTKDGKEQPYLKP